MFSLRVPLHLGSVSGSTDAKRSHGSGQPELRVPRHFGLEAVVDGDSPPVVQLDADRIQTQVLSERSSADTDQQHVTRQSLVLPAGCRLHPETHQHTRF